MTQGHSHYSEAVAGLERLFLEPSGWKRSYLAQKPVDKDGNPLPWYTYGAIEFLSAIVRPHMKVFEYGSGQSTLWWSRMASVSAVEHDSEWFQQISASVPEPNTITLKSRWTAAPPRYANIVARFSRRSKKTDWPYSIEKTLRRGLIDEGYEAYCAEVMHFESGFDVIVIDGMARRLCAEFSVLNLRDSGLIVLDNSNRSCYSLAFEIFAEQGFRHIPFWGLVPGADFMSCTSVFLRDADVLLRSEFQPNSLKLPEY